MNGLNKYFMKAEKKTPLCFLVTQTLNHPWANLCFNYCQIKRDADYEIITDVLEELAS
jgi:hypothetical protein